MHVFCVYDECTCMYLYGFICNGREWGGDTKNVIVGIVEEREGNRERQRETEI